MALTTLTLIKQFLNETSTANDAWLSALQAAAEVNVKRYCDRDFEVATYTEYLHGNGLKSLVLRHRPVRSVTSVHFDHDGNFGQTSGAFDSTTLLTEGTDYCLQLDGTYNGSAVSFCGVLWKIHSLWPEIPRVYLPSRVTPDVTPSRGSVKVVYSAGYDPIPMDVQYAVAWIVAFMKRTVGLGGHIKSEEIGDYSYELFAPRFLIYPELGTAAQLLSRYREVAW